MNDSVWTYVEFYSGIGGWSLALERACYDINTDAKGESPSSASAATSSNSNSNTTCSKGQVQVKRLASYDHSDLCNSVFAHNFFGGDGDGDGEGESPPPCRPKKKKKKKKARNNSTTNTTAAARRPPPATSLPSYPIEKLTARDLSTLNADIWAMSPPCQPHTRQHDKHAEQQELKDHRSKSFLHLINLLCELGTYKLPKIILLENVVAFEASASCQRYKSALSDNGYSFAEYHLTPTQVGISNDRPRYYCVAVHRHIGYNNVEDIVATELENMLQNPKQKKNSSNNSSPSIHTSVSPLGVVAEASSPLPTIASYLDKDLPPLATDPSTIDSAKLASLQISKSTIAKSASWCFDIITKDDTRSACFTSSYGKYVKGTGSVLYYGEKKVEMSTSQGRDDTNKNDEQATDAFRFVSPQDRTFNAKWWESLVQRDANDSPPLRYLSGTEVARLMGFPLKNDEGDGAAQVTAFNFPDWCTERQKWRLLGNSINVAISARMAEVGMRLYLSSGRDQ